MDFESYRNGAKLLVSIPQCETCENFIAGDLLHCKCFDRELKLRETEERRKREEAKAAEGEAESVEKASIEELTESEKKAESEKKTESLEKADAEKKTESLEKADAEKTAKSEKTAKKKKVTATYFWKAVSGCAVVAALAGGAAYWRYCQPRFHDLTVELGTETISIESFMTEFADIQNSGIVTDLSTIDISVAGSIPLTLRSGRKDETVTLTIEDTTPPEAAFISRLQKTPDYTPNPYDFVTSYYDLSDVNVYFAEDAVIPSNYETQSFTVVVEDVYGNAVSQVCTLSIIWMKSEYTLELGDTLRKEDLLFNPERDGYRIGQGDINAINESGTGAYTVASLMDESVCQVHVVDTTPPELTVTDVSVFKGEEIYVDDFIESCSDASNEIAVRLVTEPDVNTLSTQTITIEVTDGSGNTTTATATLSVVRDKTPPVIKGLTTLNVAKHSSPNFLAGVSAIDAADGACEVAYDASGVNLDAAGTYYVTYTSKDKDGNVAISKRTVVVAYDQADTDALVDSIAAGLSSDPEAIRDYVRNTIQYSHNSGGNNPIWYGFTNKSGDCYVHAVCLQALLTRKGYETQLIWVTNRSHYWLIIKLNGVWRHIDATPGRLHSKYSLMTDEQRYSILQGRNWDRSAWPACE